MEIVINQMAISDYAADKNTHKVISLVDNQPATVDFILFPELCLTGFPTAANLVEQWHLSQPLLAEIVAHSRSTRATLVLGHLERQEEHYYNSCYYIRDGEIIHRYRKRHLWLDDIGIFSAGEAETVCHIDGICCGSQICFDLEFPEGSRSLARQGAELILMPNGNMKPYGNTHFILSQARAIENQCFVATCNRTGSGHGGYFVGESLVISPTGELLAHLGEKEESLQVAIDISEIKNARNTYNYLEQL